MSWQSCLHLACRTQRTKLDAITSINFRRAHAVALAEIDKGLSEVEYNIATTIETRHRESLEHFVTAFMQYADKAPASKGEDGVTVLRPLLRVARGHLRTAEACDLLKLSTMAFVQEWDAKHQGRLLFCETVAEVLTVAWPPSAEDADFDIPTDEVLAQFTLLYGQEAKSIAFLGGLDMGVWLPVHETICKGIDEVFVRVAKGLGVRAEVLDCAAAVLKEGKMLKAGRLSDEVWLSLPSACDDLYAFAQRLIKIRLPAMMKGVPSDLFLIQASLCYAAGGLQKLVVPLQKAKVDEKSRDLSAYFNCLRVVAVGTHKLQSMLKLLELAPQTLRTIEAAQALSNAILEEKGDAVQKVLGMAMKPLATSAGNIATAMTALDLLPSIDNVVSATSAAEAARGEQLLKLARGSAARHLLQAVGFFDDAMRVAGTSFAGWNGGVEASFKDSDEWQTSDKVVAEGRAMLAICNLLQEMYKKSSAAREDMVKGALAKLSKKWPFNKEVLEAANKMIS